MLLDQEGRTPRCVERHPYGLPDLLRRPDECEPTLALPIGRLDDTGEADPFRGLFRLARPRADLVERLGDAPLGEPLSLA